MNSNSICFLTAGKKECRSWILKKGSSAVEAAGKIHSDIARGFVRAEVVHIDEILNFADEKEIGDIQNQGDKDELYQSALEIIRSEGKASTSFLQRKLQIGYNRAARIIDMMETDGIVSKANHVGKRDVL